MTATNTYKKMIRQAVLKVLIALLIVGIFAFVAYEISGSVLVAVLISFSILIMMRFFIRVRSRERSRQLARVFSSRFACARETPHLDDSDKIWVKGVGYIAGMNQPVWVKADNGGLNFYYLSELRTPPMIVPWSEIASIYFYIEGDLGMAEIFIHGIDEDVHIPWSESFSQYIPHSVAVSKK